MFSQIPKSTNYDIAKTVYFHIKRHFAAPLKENKTFFVKNLGFIDSEFGKMCHKQDII